MLNFTYAGNFLHLIQWAGFIFSVTCMTQGMSWILIVHHKFPVCYGSRIFLNMIINPTTRCRPRLPLSSSHIQYLFVKDALYFIFQWVCMAAKWSVSFMFSTQHFIHKHYDCWHFRSMSFSLTTNVGTFHTANYISLSKRMY